MFPKLLHRSKKKRSGPTLRGFPVTMATLRHYVIFDRDRVCVAWIADPMHECRDAWGYPHGPKELALLEFAHVPEQGQNAYGRKAPDDEQHGVAECHDANANVTRELREFERGWIARHEPAATR